MMPRRAQNLSAAAISGGGGARVELAGAVVVKDRIEVGDRIVAAGVAGAQLAADQAELSIDRHAVQRGQQRAPISLRDDRPNVRRQLVVLREPLPVRLLELGDRARHVALALRWSLLLLQLDERDRLALR